MKLTRMVSWAALGLSGVTLYLVLKTPKPVATPQPPAVAAANAQSFQNKMTQLEQAKAEGQPLSEVHLTAGEVGAVMAQAMGALPNAGQQAAPTAGGEAISGEPRITGEPLVSFEGDVVHGQFAGEIGGKQVIVTVSGHLGSKDGYATFQPTEFKVGDLSVPVSLVNDALQKKMAEQREQLKLPDSVGDLKVENGELVVTPK